MTSVGRTLHEDGWSQGCLFQVARGSTLRLLINEMDKESGASQPAEQVWSDEDLFILVTQDCDLVAADDQEPYVEALACSRFPPNSYPGRGNSHRVFPLDRREGLVAWAGARILLDKALLRAAKRIEWPGTPERKRDFVRWLGSRYTRPALHDDVVDAFQRPLTNSLRATKPAGWVHLDGLLKEVRVTDPATAAPPWDVDILFMLERDRLSQDELEALAQLEARIRAVAAERDLVRIQEAYRHTAGDIVLADYLATVPLALEEFSFRGRASARPYDAGF